MYGGVFLKYQKRMDTDTKRSWKSFYITVRKITFWPKTMIDPLYLGQRPHSKNPIEKKEISLKSKLSNITELWFFLLILSKFVVKL